MNKIKCTACNIAPHPHPETKFSSLIKKCCEYSSSDNPPISIRRCSLELRLLDEADAPFTSNELLAAINTNKATAPGMMELCMISFDTMAGRFWELRSFNNG